MILLLTACRDPEPAAALEDPVEAILASLTLEDKVAQMHGSGLATVDGLWRSGGTADGAVPELRMSDGPRGVTAGQSTAFPVAMARAATFDPELEAEIGEAMGHELAAKGGNVLLAPAINLLRHPGWGRAQETYGEDGHLLGEMGVAFVQGAQQHVLATVKHFAANSIEDTRFTVDVQIDERALREQYLPHFRRVVDEGDVASVMTAYNRVNGAYCAENPVLLGILKDEWGFDGFVMSDWILGTRSTAPSLRAGLDLEMPSGVFYGDPLLDAVAAGEVDEAAIDDAVRRILRQTLRFEVDQRPVPDLSVVESPAHVELALEAALESAVLLKNDGALLPLSSSARLAVVGQLAAVANLGDEGSSNVSPSRAVSPLDGLGARFAVDAVTALDAAVVVVGLTGADEGENVLSVGGDRDTLALHPEDVELIEAVAALNPQTVVIVEAGAAVTMTSWIDAPAAVMFVFYPGMEGGTAIASLLAGDRSPGGRLPFTIPVDEADLGPFDHVSDAVTYDAWHGYRLLDRDGTGPLFPFGFGLTYSTFALEGLDVAESEGLVTAQVTVRNSGAVSADAVVQVYVGAPGPDRAVRELRGFQRVTLSPGQEQPVAVEIRVDDLARWDTEGGEFVVDPGTYQVEAGFSARDLPLSGEFEVE